MNISFLVEDSEINKKKSVEFVSNRVISGLQVDSYKKLNKIRNDNKEKLSEKDIKELMHHSSYRRSRRGAIKQVR